MVWIFEILPLLSKFLEQFRRLLADLRVTICGRFLQVIARAREIPQRGEGSAQT